jgi:endoglucanase
MLSTLLLGAKSSEKGSRPGWLAVLTACGSLSCATTETPNVPPTTTGGSSSTGGIAAASGGTSTGGVATGGVATGGVPTGGKTTGGTSSGGAAIGGTTGTGGRSGTGGISTLPGCNFPAPAGSPVATHGQLKVVGTKVQDQSGNPVNLKGISSYWLNWEGQLDAEGKAGMQSMRDTWKVSIVRASMGTDVSGGYIGNEAAMQARIDTIMSNGLALGVYVVVDWHAGDAPSTQSQAVTFFTNLATKYGACPNILYEDFNEPVNLTWAQIKPYHEAIVSAIRAKDPDNVIILGTPNYSQRVDQAAADPVSGTNLLYTLHWYSCSHAQWLRTYGDAAMSKGLALFVTEFGATNADGGRDGVVCTAEANLWFTWMAQNGIGGTAWKLARGTDSSNLLASGAPAGGPWTDSNLSQLPTGHGQFVVNWIRQ